MPGEVVVFQEDEKPRSFDFETSEDKRRWSRGRSQKKKTTNASLRLTNSLRKRRKRVANCRYALISIKDVGDAEEEEAVITFGEALVARDMLPAQYNDYHTMLRVCQMVKLQRTRRHLFSHSKIQIPYRPLKIKTLGRLYFHPCYEMGAEK